MHSSSIFFVLCATTALAGPIVNHQHNHMEFHQRNARDTDAERFLNFLESDAPDGALPTSSANVVAEKVVDAPIVVTTVTEGAPAPPASTAPASSSPAPVPQQQQPPQPQQSQQANNDVKEKISGPPVAQPQVPAAKQPHAPSTSSAPSSGNGLPNVPTDYQASLSSDDQTYKDLALFHHNIHRLNHSLPALEWNDTLRDIAKTSAEACVYEHTNPTPPYGQNIAAGNSPGNVASDITNGFYNGEIGLFHEAIGEYGNNSPDMGDFEHWGHVTQMLWKSTTSVGCYTATCSPPGQDPLECGPGQQTYLKYQPCGPGNVRAYFLVCNYYPPGKNRPSRFRHA